MNKSELVNVVATKTKLSRVAASAAVDALLKAIRDSLSRGNPVSLIGFGSFSVSKRSARKGRNPQTNKPIMIAAKKVPRFRAGAKLKAAVKRAK